MAASVFGMGLVNLFAAVAASTATTSSAVGLYVATCSRKAAEWAVRGYHYSRSLPSGRALYFGVWEADFQRC